MIASRVASLMLGSVLLLGACEGARNEPETGADPADTDSAATGGMADMPGMVGDLMAQLSAHTQTMRGADADSRKAMLPMHRQLLANMIAQMNREMRDMNMITHAQWNATVDSLRSDLTRMPELNTGQLHAFMPAHHERVTRLMEMHRAMMKNMNM